MFETEYGEFLFGMKSVDETIELVRKYGFELISYRDPKEAIKMIMRLRHSTYKETMLGLTLAEEDKFMYNHLDTVNAIIMSREFDDIKYAKSLIDFQYYLLEKLITIYDGVGPVDMTISCMRLNYDRTKELIHDLGIVSGYHAHIMHIYTDDLTVKCNAMDICDMTTGVEPFDTYKDLIILLLEMYNYTNNSDLGIIMKLASELPLLTIDDLVNEYYIRNMDIMQYILLYGSDPETNREIIFADMVRNLLKRTLEEVTSMYLSPLQNGDLLTVEEEVTHNVLKMFGEMNLPEHIDYKGIVHASYLTHRNVLNRYIMSKYIINDTIVAVNRMLYRINMIKGDYSKFDRYMNGDSGVYNLHRIDENGNEIQHTLNVTIDLLDDMVIRSVVNNLSFGDNVDYVVGLYIEYLYIGNTDYSSIREERIQLLDKFMKS